jgi:hypothetical protein
MSFQHATLAAHRWFDFSLAEQLGNIGSEVSRAIRARKDPKLFDAAVSRALELFDLTIRDPRWKTRLKEILIARELFCKAVKEKTNDGTLDYLNRYFSQFACASHNPHVQARGTLDALFQFIDNTFLAYFVALDAQKLWSPHLANYESKETWRLKETGYSSSMIQDHILINQNFPLQVTTKQLRMTIDPENFENIQAKNVIKVIYDDWDFYYRKKLEELLSKTIQSDIWRDLGYIRQSITHRRSLGVDKLKNAKIITDFKPGEKIILTSSVMKQIYAALEQWYADFLMDHFSNGKTVKPSILEPKKL